MRRTVAAALGLAAGAGDVRAEWMHQVAEDAFQGDTQIAMALEAPGYGLGFRCHDADDLTLVFITPEHATDDAVKGLGAVGPKLLVIVDTAPKVELTADVQLTNGGDKLAFSSAGGAVRELVTGVAAAKRRVAVAVEVLGKIAHSVTFGAGGSGRALKKLSDACKLGKPE